jgi:ribosomal protein S20
MLYIMLQSKKRCNWFSKLKGDQEPEKTKKTISLIDKAAKRKVIHKNKAARLKSRVMKMTAKKK